MPDEGGADHPLDVADRAFHRERIDRAERVVHARGASPEQPEPAGRVEVAGVAGAMPDAAADVDLRVLVTAAIEIPAENVRAGDDDFAGLAGRKRYGVEAGRVVRSERPSPAVGDDAQL